MSSDRLEAAIRGLAEVLVDELRAEVAAEPAAAMPDRLLDVASASAALGGVSRSTLYGFIGSGQLRSISVGRHRFIPSTALAEFIAGRSDPP